MSSKLRVYFDRFYAGTETFLLARGAVKSGKKYAATVEPQPDIEEKYKTEIRPYWKQFRVRTPKLFWFRLFSNAARPYSPKYIPDDLWFGRIVPHFNNIIFAHAMQDKCLHNVLFPDLKRPVTLVKCVAGVFYDDGLDLLTRQEAIDRCKGHGRILAKPSVGSGQGHSIRFYDSDSFTDEDVEAIFKDYGQNFIVQEKLAQHPDIARLNPRSLNTVRVVSFLYGGQVHILAAILRVGGGDNEVDNTSQGGYKCNIGPGGRLSRLATTNINGRWQYDEMTPGGVRFEDVTVPSFDRIVDAVKTHAAKMSHFKIIGWDMAVDTAGDPVLVEYNVIPAQGHCTGGPVFGELTDDVLAEVFGRRKG